MASRIQGHVDLAADVVVGLEAAVGQDEHVLGIDPRRQRLDGAAVGGIGGGGRDAGRLPEEAAEEAGELADQQPRPLALDGALLAGLLDEGFHPPREGRRVEAAGVGQLVDHAATEGVERLVGQATPGRSGHAAVGQVCQPRGLGWVVGDVLVEQDTRQVGLGERVEPEDAAPRDDRVELGLGRGADQDEHRARRGFFEGLEEGVGGLVVEVVGVVDDRHLCIRPAAGLRPRSRQRSRISLIERSCLSSGRATRWTSGCVPAATWRQLGQAPQGSRSASGARSQRRACAKVSANDRLPIPSGPAKRKACGSRPWARERREGVDRPVMASDRSPGHAPPRPGSGGPPRRGRPRRRSS